MTAEQLTQYAKEKELEIDWRGGAGKFRDVYLGFGKTGKMYSELTKICEELKQLSGCDTDITTVTNPEHKDYGKLMIELKSFWW